MLLWMVISSTQAAISSAKDIDRYQHCVPNAELYCRKKAEHQPATTDEQACRDEIIEACRNQRRNQETWNEIAELAGNTAEDRQKRIVDCKKQADMFISKCEIKLRNIENPKQKSASMRNCIRAEERLCATEATMKAGHLRLVIKTHGHPKGEGFDHYDEL